MKLISFVFILALVAACGKDGGSGSSSSANKDACSLNGRAVSCESITGADGLGIDLLDSMIDVPVKMTESEIQFLSDKTAVSQGRRISCKTAVKSGETYRYALRGDTLIVMTSAGSYEMQRLTEGESIIGTWAWKGYEDEGTHIIRQLTFLSETRVLVKTNCEL